MKEISELNINPFTSIGKDWFLITAGGRDSFNTMTGGWGNMGFIWGKNVIEVMVRPTRHTFPIIEKEEYFSVSFFDDVDKSILSFCGAHSGRDTDKVKETGLVPVFDEDAVYFRQAKLTFICKKIYTDRIKAENMIDKDIMKNYPLADFHTRYIGEIVKVIK